MRTRFVKKYAFKLAKANQRLDAAGLNPELAQVGIDAAVRVWPDFPTRTRHMYSQQFEMTADSVGAQGKAR